MDGLRIACENKGTSIVPCCRCGNDQRPWDRIAGKVFCPNCQEAVLVGEAEPLIEPARKDPCAICATVGTVRYLTFPLHHAAVEIDLCAEHLHGLVARRLVPPAFHQLCRLLGTFGLAAGDVFLLHESFYDPDGQALRPAAEPD